MSKEFSIRDTNICKGIAIVFMVLHHLIACFYNSFDLSWYISTAIDKFGGTSLYVFLPILFLSTAGKVCVSLLSILSGYGITKKYIKFGGRDIKFDIKYVLSRIIKFYSIYIPVFVFLFIYNFIFEWNCSFKNIVMYYCGSDNIFNFIMYFIFDIFGLYILTKTNSIIQTWYVFAIMIYYVLFPLLYRLVEKYKYLFILICCIPWIIIMIFGGSKPDAFYSYLGDFSLGILFARFGILDNIKNNINIKNKLISTIVLFISFVLRLIFSLPMDSLFAVSIIIFEIEMLSNTKYISHILSKLGIYSANIWLIHIFIKFRFINNIALKYLSIMILCFLFSYVIEFIKEKTGFNAITKTIINKILASRKLS